MAGYFSELRLSVLLILRSKFVPILIAMVVLVAAGAWLAGEFSPRQPATVALDVGLSLIRILVPCLAILYVQDLIGREIERKLIYTSLSYPRSRTVFLLGRSSAVVLVAAILSALLALVLSGVVWLAGKTYEQSTAVDLVFAYGGTLAFSFLDFVVVIAFSCLMAAIATTPHLVLLASLGFLVIARSASTIIRLLERGEVQVQGASLIQQGLHVVSLFLPDLGALDVRMIALYGKWNFLPEAWWALVVMAIGYAALLMGLACWKFERRQFG